MHLHIRIPASTSFFVFYYFCSHCHSIEIHHPLSVYGAERPSKNSFFYFVGASPFFLKSCCCQRAIFLNFFLHMFRCVDTIAVKLLHFIGFSFRSCFYSLASLNFYCIFSGFEISIELIIYIGNEIIARCGWLLTQITETQTHTRSNTNNADTQTKRMIDLPRTLKLTTKSSVMEFK